MLQVVFEAETALFIINIFDFLAMKALFVKVKGIYGQITQIKHWIS